MSIDIRITGTANMGQVASELKKVQAQTAMLSRNFAAANAQLGAGGSSGAMQNQIRNYRQWGVAMNGVRDDLLDITRANGNFQTSSMKVGKHVDYLTERIQKQQLGFREARKEAKALGDVYRHQLALQQAHAVTWGQTAAGSSNVDLFTPNLGKQAASIDMARAKMGFYGEVLSSVSKKTVDWGKNTQWAGRQLMSGFTYPLTIAAGVAAKYAYDIDKGLTQIVKVYGDAKTGMTENDEQIKQSAMQTAGYLTQFGQAATETLEIQSQLASTGKTGKELQDMTKVVSKARLLGELDIQDAMKATITMQSVYGYSTEKLTEKFNFMNQMENETSLTMQDFVVGIPKVSGVMKSLGADFEDTGILLTAMKTAGIDAKEGGNAVKSMVFKDIAPSGKALKVFSEATGQSLQTIVDTTKGDPVKTLQGIGEAMKGLPGEEKVRIIKEVFGIHQGSKALGMIDALTNKTGQMGKAFEIASMDTEEWATTANKELTKLKNSDWVKAKKAMEDLKLGLAEFGKVVLHEATPAIQAIAGGIKKFAGWFANLGDGAQKATLLALGIAAIAGPTIMMIGLFANLGGQGMAAVASFMKLTGKIELFTSKQKLAQLAAQQSAKSIQSIAGANMQLASSIDVLNKKAYTNLNPAVASKTNSALAAQSPARASAAPAAGSYAVAGGAAAGSYSSRMTPVVVDKASVANSSKIMNNSEATKRSWHGVGRHMQSLAIGAGMIGSMSTSTDSMVYKLSNAVFLAGLIGPTVVKGIQSSGAIAAISKMGATLAASAAIAAGPRAGKAGAFGGKIVAGAAAAKTGIMALGASVASMAGPIGIAAAAFGALFYMQHKKTEEAKAKIEALSTSTETLAEQLGIVLKTTEKIKIGENNSPNVYREAAKEYLKEHKDIAKALSEVEDKSKEAAVAWGKREGRQARALGATPAEAAEQARVAAVAYNSSLANTIDTKITKDMFLEVKEARITNIDRVKRRIQDIFDKEKFEISPIVNERGSDKDGLQAVTVKKEWVGKLQEDATKAWKLYAAEDGKAAKQAFQQIGQGVDSSLDEFWKSLSDKQKKAMAKEGIVDQRTLAEWSDKNGGPEAVVKMMTNNGAGLGDGQKQKLAQAAAVIKELLKQYLRESTNLSEKEINKKVSYKIDFDMIANEEDMPKLQKTTKELEAANKSYTKEMELAKKARSALTNEEKNAARAAYQKEYGPAGLILYAAEMEKAEGGTKKLAKAEELARLNTKRRSLGLKETNNIQDGLNRKVTKSAEELKKETKATQENTKAKDANGKAGTPGRNIMAGGADEEFMITNPSKEEAQAAVDQYKQVWENVTDSMFEEVANDLENQHTAALDRIEADSERREKGIDARAEAGAARFERRQEAMDEANARSDEKFEAKWTTTMENFDKGWERKSEKFESRWDNTMRKFEAGWEKKTERFNAKWDRTMENFDKKWDAKGERFDSKWDNVMEKFGARWDAKMEKFDDRWDAKMERFDDKWDKINEKFDARWDRTMEKFDERWDKKNEDFEAKWDKTMENFDKRAEASKKRVEAIYDARIKKIEDAIEAERKAEELRQKIFEKEKARIAHLANMANTSINIDVALNSGEFDEAARLSNDAQAAADEWEVDDAAEESQTGSERRISGLENRKEGVQKSKDAAIKRIEERIEAERKALEEQKKIAQKALEVEQKKERKILEAQRQRQQKSLAAQREAQQKALNSQREAQRKALESQRASQQKALDSRRAHERKMLDAARERNRKILENQRNTDQKLMERQKERQQRALESHKKNQKAQLDAQKENQRKSLESQKNAAVKSREAHKKAMQKRLDREKKTFDDEIQAARDSNKKITKSKRDAEDKRYKAAKDSLDAEMKALKAFTPRNRRELRDHIEKLERSYGKFGYRMEGKGKKWSKKIGDSLEYEIRVARNEMSSSDKWDKLGRTVANRMTKGAFNKSLPSFMKWVEGGGGGDWSSAEKKKKKRLPRQAAKKSRSTMDKALTGRHKGGMIDNSKGDRTGFSGKYQSQSEVTINALKGEAVLNRKAVKSVGGKAGVDAINKGKALAKGNSPRARAVRDDQTHERGGPLGIGGIAGIFAAKAVQMAMGKAIKDKGEEKQEEEAAAMSGFGAFSGSNFEAFWKALGIQESGGNYRAVNRDSGALGKYQVMPANVNRWAQMFLGRSMSPSAFLNSPKLQDELVKAALGSMYKKHGPRGAAAEWYSGQPGLHMSTRRQPGGPSIKGYVDGVISKMNKLIGSRNAGGGGGLPPRTPSGAYKVWPGMGWKKQWAIVKRRWPRRGYPDPGQINRGGHVKNSYHYRNRAIDLGSAKANGDSMMSLFNWLYKNYGRQSTQIIYGRARSRNILNGRHHNYGAGTAAAHMGHIHWAMKNGGLVPGTGSGDKTRIMGEPGEFMVRKKAVDKVGPEFLKALNSDRFINMPTTAPSSVGAAGESRGDNIDNSYSPEYNVTIEVSGNQDPYDISKAVENVLIGLERRKGFNRRIGTK